MGAHSADDHTSVDDKTESADDADDAVGHSADDHTSVDDATESADDAHSADDHTSVDDKTESADDAIASADDGSVDDATESVDDSVPNAVVVVQGITDMVNSLIDNNYGTPPPTPAPTADDKDNAIDDVVSS